MKAKNVKVSPKGKALAILLGLTVGFSLTACGNSNSSSKRISESITSTSIVDYDDEYSGEYRDYNSSDSIDIGGTNGESESSELEVLNDEEYLSEDLYKSLKKAIPATKKFLGSTSVCDVMRDDGVNVPDSYVEKLDTVVPDLFRQYQKYVEAYDNGDGNAAIAVAKKIDEYYNDLSYSDLYNITVKDSLPEEFKGECIKKDYFGIALDNNKTISSVYNDGGLFDLTDDECMDSSVKNDNITKISSRLDYYENLPEMLSRQYVPIKNTAYDADLDVCYVWCESQVENLLDEKLNQIKDDAISLYSDLDVNSCQVVYTNGCWCFVDNSGNLVGELDSMSSFTASSINEVQEALDSKEGSVSRLGGILSSYASNSLENGYTYKNE